jgi:hypothetical protein
VLFDEPVERVEPDREPGRGRAAGLGDRLGERREELTRVLLEQLGVEVLLGGEVLVDERFGDAPLACDVVDRRRVVAAFSEDGQRGIEVGGATLFAGEALAWGGAQSLGVVGGAG